MGWCLNLQTIEPCGLESCSLCGSSHSQEGPSCQILCICCRTNDYRASSHGYNKHTDSTTRGPC